MRPTSRPGGHVEQRNAGPRRRRAGSRLALLLAVAAVAVAACGGSGGGTTTTTTSRGPSQPDAAAPVLSTSPPPWPLPQDAAPYIEAAGLTALPRETLAVHYHAHLDIVVNGQPQPVPAGVGFLIRNGQAVALTSLHTHDDSGIIHIESPRDVPFRLGQFFTQWGVKLDATTMGGLTTGGGNELRLYVDGARNSTSPDQLVLRPHQEIVLWYGPSTAQPDVPSSYAFPPGD